jgi:hypothetical protein
MDKRAVRTVTVRRPDQDITVELHYPSYHLIQAIDEDGNAVVLTQMERAWVDQQMLDGHDETGR